MANPEIDNYLPPSGDLPPSGKSPVSGKSARYAALCLPMYRDITYETWDFVDQVRAHPVPAGWNPVNVQPAKSHPVFLTRERIVENLLALEAAAGIEHEILLWVDSDCGLATPAEAWALVTRLSTAPPSVGILGAPCRMRGFEANLANVWQLETAGNYDMGQGVVLPSRATMATHGHPFVLVDGVGFGVVAMRARIFRELPKPWFDFRWADTQGKDVPVGQRLVGEDRGLCRRVRGELKLQTVVDYSMHAWHLVEERAILPAQALLPFSTDASWR